MMSECSGRKPDKEDLKMTVVQKEGLTGRMQACTPLYWELYEGGRGLKSTATATEYRGDVERNFVTSFTFGIEQVVPGANRQFPREKARSLSRRRSGSR